MCKNSQTHVRTGLHEKISLSLSCKLKLINYNKKIVIIKKQSKSNFLLFLQFFALSVKFPEFVLLSPISFLEGERERDFVNLKFKNG